MNINRFNHKVQIALLVFLSAFVIASPCLAATYYVDATNGNDENNGTSQSSPWKTIAKVNSSNFNPGAQILFKGGRFGEGNLSFLLQDNKPNRLSVSLIHLSMPDTLFSVTPFSLHPCDLKSAARDF